jgi:gluconokinase
VSQDDNAPTLVEPGLFCYRIDRSHVLVGGALTDGGSVVEWISHLLNMAPVDSDKFQECLKEAAELLEEDYQNCSTASSPTLTVVPLLSGERSTGFRSGATGAVLGLTRETTPAHLLKACLEGVTMRLAATVKLLMTVTGKQDNDATPRIMASGKALEFNDLWRRMLADCTGLGVILDRDTEEGTSRGVAKLVSVALTMEREQATDSTRFLTTENVQSSCSCQPRQEARIYWDRACNVQESLLEAISPLYSKI